MDESSLLTAEEFAAQRFDLPDSGRWVELVAGRVVMLDAPDEAHGTTLLNLSKSLAAHVQQHAGEADYACFSSGLVVTRGPDTVRFPPICYFLGSERFAEADKLITETVPALVVEIASTRDRRREMTRRVEELLDWGVQLVWVADPLERQIHVFQGGRKGQILAEHHSLTGGPVLKGFRIRVGDLFAVPQWWQAPK